MSDVLSALFARKKEKKQKNKVNVDFVGEILQKRTREQEMMAEEEKRATEDEAFLKSTVQEDENEWIEYGNEVDRFEGLKIKDMGAKDSDEDEHTAVEHQNGDGHQSGWRLLDKEGSEEEEMAGPEQMVMKTASTAPKAYVAPNLRSKRSAAALDLNNEEMFPTIGAAGEIEKQHKEDKKNPWTVQRTTQGAETTESATSKKYLPPSRRDGLDGGELSDSLRPASIFAARKDAIEAVRKISATPTSSPLPPARNPQSEGAKAVAEPVAEAKTKSAYVPPHLRQK